MIKIFLYNGAEICFSESMLTRDEAKKIIQSGEEATICKLQELSAEVDRLRGLSPHSPTTPSGQKPTFLKPTKRKRKKKPGQKKGHKGVRRSGLKDEDVKATIYHPLNECPDCALPLPGDPEGLRDRLVEELPEVTVQVVRHRRERKTCPRCNKVVEAPMADALPGSQVGIRLAVFSAFLHYFVGISLRNIKLLLEVSSGHQISIGGLTHIWKRLANLLSGEYDKIANQIRHSKVVCGDETGWRVCGKLAWLWAFVTENACIYLIEPFRNGKVVKRFLGKNFNGTLSCDFWGAYNKVHAAFKQRCLYHLFTEMKKVDIRSNSLEWKAWRKLLSRLLRDGVRLAQKYGEIPEADYNRLKDCILSRFSDLLARESADQDVRRLTKRLNRHRKEIFTFLDNPFEVSPYNNRAEQIIRPSVLMRKISQQNRSFEAARVQAILMTIFRTANLRGENPFTKVLEMVQELLKNNSTAGIRELMQQQAA